MRTSVAPASTAHLQIAGIQWRIPCSPSDYDGFPHAGFLIAPSDSRSAVRVDVRAETGPVVVPPRMACIFDCGTWRLYAAGPARCLAWRGERRSSPKWSVRFRADRPTRVRITWDAPARRGGLLAPWAPLIYPIDQILLTYALAHAGGSLIHAAGVSLGGHGFFFAGRSGAGKSTIARLLTSLPDIRMLSDDRVVVRGHGARFRVHGTPWHGDGRMALNESAPLRAVFFLEKAVRNRILSLSATEACERLMPVASIPWYDRAVSPRFLSFCERLVTSVPAFRLQFRPDPAAADMVRRFVRARRWER